MSVSQFESPVASGLATMSAPVLLALLSSLCGCRGEARTAPRQNVRGAAVERSFKLYELIEQNRPQEGVQHREAHAIVADPETRDEVRLAARTLYDALHADIEQVQQAASEKRISVLIYDSLSEARARHREPILRVISGTADTLPAWEDVEIIWQWRDPKTRPQADELRIYREYHERLTSVHAAPATIHPHDFIDTAAAREQERLLARRIMKTYGLRPDEFARILARIHVWRSGNTPDAVAIERLAQEYRQAWDEAYD